MPVAAPLGATTRHRTDTGCHDCMDCIACADHHPVTAVCLQSAATWHRKQHSGAIASGLTYEFAYEAAVLAAYLPYHPVP